MKRIFKYTLEVAEEQVINLPFGFKILSIQVQAGKPCIWVLIDDAHDGTEEVYFYTIGTGHSADLMPNNFVGTYQYGPLVFHVFYRNGQQSNPIPRR
jgi:hypothetical protein